MTTGFEQLDVSQLRAYLVAQCGYTEEQAASIKGKSYVANEIVKQKRSHEQVLAYFGDVEDSLEDLAETVVIEDEDESPFLEVAVAVKDKVREPSYSSPEWQAFVMSHFVEDELFEGRPTVYGLRRVVEKVLGEIVASGPRHYDYFPSEPAKAVCHYEVQIEWKRDVLGEHGYLNLDNEVAYPIRTFGGLADASPMNTDDMYAAFPTAIAEVRAEGRALRKALNIKVNTAEEMTQKNTAELVAIATNKESVAKDWSEQDAIQHPQKSFIILKCDQLGIDVDKFINKKHYTEGGPKNYESIEQVTRGVAGSMIAELNKYQSDAGKESKGIPVEIMKEKS